MRAAVSSCPGRVQRPSARLAKHVIWDSLARRHALAVSPWVPGLATLARDTRGIVLNSARVSRPSERPSVSIRYAEARECEPGPRATRRRAETVRRVAPGSRVSLRSPGTREGMVLNSARVSRPSERPSVSIRHAQARECEPGPRATRRCGSETVGRAAPGSRVSLRSPGTRCFVSKLACARAERSS